MEVKDPLVLTNILDETEQLRNMDEREVLESPFFLHLCLLQQIVIPVS
jgi:hypothetical protein